MKNKKGFTLIELLAVIVILAIIALIATPIVLNMIESARKSAAKSSALGYIDAIEYNNGFAMLGSDAGVSGYTKVESGDIANINIKLKGKKPESGTVTIDSSGKITEAELCVNGYKVKYENRDVTNVTKGCDGSSESSSSETTPTTNTVYNLGQTVKFDPVANASCTSGDTCYTWRVITTDDTTSNTEIKLQMDHNIVNLSSWSPSDNTVGPTNALSALEEATSGWNNALKLNYIYNTAKDENNNNVTNNYGTLSCTNGACKIGSGSNFTTNLKARLITGEEVTAITKTKNPDLGWTLSSSHGNYYYFSSTTHTIGTNTDGTGNTDLKWLIENTTDYDYNYSGASANTYGNTNHGYWTLSPCSSYLYGAWVVDYSGNLYSENRVVYLGNSYGLRPVITISKSQLN